MRKYSKYLFGLASIFFAFGFLLYFVSHLIEYAVFVFTICVICVFAGIVILIRYRSPDVAYESRVEGILNTFDSILVRSSTIPNLDGRNIVPVMSMDDMIDAQLEIRKPICYLKQTESCSFVLLDDKEAYVYVEKINDDVLSPVEIAIRDIKIQNKSKNDMDAEMLRDIDKTTVVKLSNQKSYRVSPIRKKKSEAKEVEVLNQTTSIPIVKSKKKSFLEHTQVIEQLDDGEEDSKTVEMTEIEML